LENFWKTGAWKNFENFGEKKVFDGSVLFDFNIKFNRYLSYHLRILTPSLHFLDLFHFLNNILSAGT
jgi:hypothetical protein